MPADLGTVTALSAGLYHTCAIRTSGAITCWGDDRFGQVSQVPSGTDWVEIRAGHVHTCGRPCSLDQARMVLSSFQIKCEVWPLASTIRMSDPSMAQVTSRI